MPPFVVYIEMEVLLLKDGILIIDKPQWFTSFDVIAKLRKILNTKKIGHTGTLDPMATGVLVICFGKATALSDYLMSDNKTYKTTIKFGIKTDTGDMSGNILDNADSDIINDKPFLSDALKEKFIKNLDYADKQNYKLDTTEEQIKTILKSFIGKQKQIPSIYSSIKVNGKKLYEYARAGENVEIPERDIEIFDICDISFNGINELTYTVNCSKGTYIRSLNEDICKKLKTIGTTLKLERVATGEYSIDNAVKIDDDNLEEKIIPLEDIFDNKIELDKKFYDKLINGMSIETSKNDGLYNLYVDNKYIGIGKITNHALKRFILV